MEGMPVREGVVVRWEGKLRQVVVAGGHQIVVDEPEAVGGEGAGASPYDLLLGALGSCTAMTLVMYAERKGWGLEGVEVRLEHDRVYVEDCVGCEGGRGRISRIRMAVTVRGALTEEEVKRLEVVAGRCPVHRTLTEQVRIEGGLVLAAK